MQLRYITDHHAESLGIDPERASEIIADAAPLYEYVNHTPNVSRDDLVKWANSKWGDTAVDRFNEALDYLQRIGKIIAVP